MMEILKAIGLLGIGSFFVWLGAFSLIANMLPHDLGIKLANDHGAWMREHVFHIPPTNNEKE